MDEEEDGKTGERRGSNQEAGEELRWDNGSHDCKVTHLSGYVTGLALSRLCIMPSTRLKNLRWTASDTTIQTDLTNHQLMAFLLVSWFLANQLYCCGYSLPTLLETKPPFL